MQDNSNKATSLNSRGLKKIVIISLSFALTNLFFTPLYVFTVNYDNSIVGSVIFTLFAMSLGCAAIIVTVSTFIVLVVTPKISDVYKVIAILFIGVTIWTWLRATILVDSFGLLDGTIFEISINLRNLKNDFIALFITAVAVFVLYRPSIQLNAVYMFIVFFQLLACAISVVLNNRDVAMGTISVPSYVFSEDKNVLLVVLDSYSGTAFRYHLAENPEIAELFDGFVFYDDAMSTAPSTELSIPHILTGEPYLNQKPYSEYLSEITYLHDLVSAYGVALQSRTNSILLPKGTLYRIYSLYAYCAAPLPLKKHFLGLYYYAHYLDDNDSVNGFMNRASNDGTGMQYNYQYLFGAHPPFMYDENQKYNPAQPQNYSSYVVNAKKSILLMQQYIEKLKELGVYDNTLVIFTADHGYGPQYNFERSSVVLLVKGFDSRGELIVSEKPVATTDIMTTILDELGISNIHLGFNLAKHKELPDKRDRLFYKCYYTSTWLAENDYVQTIWEYTVSKGLEDPQSWKFTGNAYNPNNRRFTNLGAPIGEIYYTDEAYPILHLSQAKLADDHGVWIDDSYAKLVFPSVYSLDGYEGDIAFNLKAITTAQGILLKFYINGNYVADFGLNSVLPETNDITLKISEDEWRFSRPLIIEIIVENPPANLLYPQNNDNPQRYFGINSYGYTIYQ